MPRRHNFPKITSKCPRCGGELRYWKGVFRPHSGTVDQGVNIRGIWQCSKCGYEEPA